MLLQQLDVDISTRYNAAFFTVYDEGVPFVKDLTFHFPNANLFSGVLISGYREKSDTFSQLFIVGDIP